MTNGTRPGQDYASVKMNTTTGMTAHDCLTICCNDGKCETWVFVPDGLYPKRPAGTFCWLKAAPIALKGNTCDNGKPGCVSGVVNRTINSIATVTPDYSTDFQDKAAVLSKWTEEDDCSHCGKRGNTECTQFTPNATTFGTAGMIHTTAQLDPSTSSCKAGATSGHITFNPDILYCNLSVVASWFDTTQNVSTATGFIGLDSAGNEASITMGFHGDGWPTADEGQFKYQHGIYADVKKTHNRDYTETTPVSLRKFNTFGLIWTPEKVEWLFNGKVVRSFTDKDNIPSIKMKLRLHTRSGYNNLMDPGSSFQASFRSFEIHPIAGPAPGPAPGPSPPSPAPPAPTPGGSAAAECKTAGGILSTDDHIACCAAECGKCGGNNCGALPGGHDNCCRAKIEKNGKDCSTSKAPCSAK
jgi:hypothetical protein